jgi:hypothetical protein
VAALLSPLVLESEMALRKGLRSVLRTESVRFGYIVCRIRPEEVRAS